MRSFNAATRSNLKPLRARGAIVVGPESGPLASGLEGPGRLAGLDAMVEAVVELMDRYPQLGMRKGMRSCVL